MSWSIYRRCPVAVAAALCAISCSSPAPVPTYTVERSAFAHRVTADGTLSAETATRVSVPLEVDRPVRLAWLAPEGTAVEKGDVVARFDPTEMEELLREGESDLDSASHKITKSEAESSSKIRELATDLEVADLQLELAGRYQKADEHVFSRHEIISSEIDEELAGDRKEHAAESGTTQRALGRTKLEILEIEQRKARLKMDQARKGLHALEVGAPHAGLVTLVRNWRGEAPQVGAQIWPGQEIIEIPNLGSMEAEVYVLEADAGQLAVGRPAEVLIEAYPERVFPATIRRVDAVAKPHVVGSPVQSFGVTLELGETDPERMKPGARVRATLLLEQHAEAVVVPRQTVRQNGGRFWVHLLQHGRFIANEVEVGATSMGRIVIASGLEPGDVIALRPPEGTGSATLDSASAEADTEPTEDEG